MTMDSFVAAMYKLHPMIAEFVDALEDEAEDKVPLERLDAALNTFDRVALSDAIARSRVTFPKLYEGNVYDWLVEGGSGDLDAYNSIVLFDVDFTYVSAFASFLWDF